MKKYIINGKFLSDSMQGIVRYGCEITKELDKQLPKDIEVIILKPKNCKHELLLNNIKQIEYGSHTGILWEQIDLRKFLLKNKEYTCINFCNVCPLFVQPGITVIHDIMYKLFPENYVSFRNKLSRLWHCFQYSYICKHEKRIITVSNFSKKDIERVYPNAKGKVNVVYSGWQHVLNYKENPNWKTEYPFLEEGKYFFSLSQLSKNKNGRWIIEVAKRNPDYIFAMGGKLYETEKEVLPDNVKLLGFVSDENACSLIKYCKAFIFPSLYEGFGLPPLEAMALGASAIVSNASCMPEIYEDGVNYINPHDYDIRLECFNDKFDAKNILDKYGWDKSADKLKKILV